MPNWSSAEKVLATIRAGDDVEYVRGQNRCKVLDAANCVPPLAQEEADKMGIKINVNWGELMETLAKARAQLISAFLGNLYFFTVKIPAAPAEHQSEWEAFITAEINRPMRESLPYFELHRSRWSSVVCHGVGPMRWPHEDRWLPKFVSMNDIRIPTDTTLDFSNLSWFAVRVAYSPFDLMEAAFDKSPNNHWYKDGIKQILSTIKECNFTDATNNYQWDTEPEKFAELWKQNGGFYGGDAMPSIPLWHFFFEDTDSHGVKGWYMRVVPEATTVKGAPDNDKFLWESDDCFGRTWQELVHCQYGDLSTDAPFKFHSVRGLGYALLEPTFYTNLTRCRALQHVHDNFNIWLRTTDPADKARAQIQDFGNFGVLKTGLSIVPQAERHQIDSGLMEMVMAQLKQLQAEASSSYTQQADTGTQKEQTAFETRVKTEQVNAMMSGILLVAFKYESFAYREICRRFCLKDSRDPDIRKFQARCLAKGIPPAWLDINQWEVEPVTPLGMGNPTIAQAAVQQLMGLRGMMNPQAQQEVLHEAVLTITKDPRKAARWAPLTGVTTESDAKREAVGLFGTLMTGVPVPLSQSNLIDQIDALLPLFAGKIVQITKRDNMASPDEAVGLQNVSAYISQAIQQLGQDAQAKEKVKNYGDAIGKLNNEMKGVIQRGAQARKKQQEQNGNGHMVEIQAKIQGDQAMTKARLEDAAVKSRQDVHLKDIAARKEQQRKDSLAAAEIRRKQAVAHADIIRDSVKTGAEIKNSRLKSVKSEKE